MIKRREASAFIGIFKFVCTANHIGILNNRYVYIYTSLALLLTNNQVVLLKSN